MIVKIEQEEPYIYEVKCPEKNIFIEPKQKPFTVLENGSSGVSILSVNQTSPGPRGKGWTWEDFTPEQLAQITPTVTVGQTTTGEPGSEASVTDSGTDKNHVLDFAIPRGQDGQRGQAATIQVAGTVTVNPDTPASVINEGSETDARFRFHIPQGVQGEVGQKGEDGISPTIRVGTTTTGQPGSQASVTNSGTAQNAILNFSIPRGAQGSQGPAGRVQDVMVSYDSGQTWESALTGNVAEIIMTGGGGGGGEINRINKIQKNGVDLPIVNKVVNVPVPTATSELTNDSGFITSASVPTKVSDLQNDSGFITASDVPQSNWAETDTTSKAYIQNKPTLVTPGSTVGNIVKSYYAENSDYAGTAMQVDLAGVTNARDLQAIEALNGQSGLLRKTDYDTWTLDTTSYATASSIPTKVSDLQNDAGFITSWGQADWNQSDNTQSDFIKNKPTQLSQFTDNLGSNPVHTHSQYAESANLATVATSGDYDDLLNKPAIHNIPSGGTTGQILTKSSNTDYDAVWTTPANPETYSVVVVTDGEIPSTLKVGQMCIVQTSRKNSSDDFYVVVPANQGWMIITGSPTVGIAPNVLASSSSTRNFVIGASSGSITSRVCFAVRTS